MADTKTVIVSEPENAKKGKRASKPKDTTKDGDKPEVVNAAKPGAGKRAKKEPKVEKVEKTTEQVEEAIEAEKEKPKKRKRTWQLTDETGKPLDGDTKTRLHGSSPYQAALKAVTRFAEEQDKEHTFHLNEIMPGRAGPSKKLYVYKGWKAPLKESEESVFTQKYNIKTKPHAKSQGCVTIKANDEVTEVEKV